MLYAAHKGDIEIRSADDGGAILAGRFPYNAEAQLAPGMTEVFTRGALRAAADVHLLSQHNYATPLASRASHSLELREAVDALEFEAHIFGDIAETSHGRDALALIRTGLAVGLSPGFTVPKGGETVERRSGGILRTIREALLHELSIVTRPAYSQAQVEARNWRPDGRIQLFTLPAACRWR